MKNKPNIIKRKNILRILALFVAVVIFAGVFVSCGELASASDEKNHSKTKSRDNVQIVEDQEDDNEPERVVRYAASSESDKFHYISCHYVDRIKSYNIVYYYTASEARSDGKSPCSVCCP